MNWRLLMTVPALVATAIAHGQCAFDANGTISNPDDPVCRDARFEFTDNTPGAGNIALGYAPPVPVDSLTAVAGFRRYASLLARHQELFLANATVQGFVAGQTLANNDIWAYRLGDDDALTVSGLPEPAIMINGTIHAREWQSPEAVTEFFEQLVERADDGHLGQFIADNLAVTIVPVLNIDGFLQTQRYPVQVAATPLQPRDGRMRRKNLRTPAGGALVDDNLDTSDDQFDGVDLNRNTQGGFGANGGSSPDPISLVYRGPQFESEPETRALLVAAAQAPPERLRFYADMHSFSQLFFVPQTANTRRNALARTLANRVRAVSDNRYILSVDPIGAQIGTTADYFALQYQIPTWTFEIEPRSGGQDYGGTGASHSGFILPADQIERVRDEVASMLWLAAYHQAGPPAVQAVQITRRSDGATVYRADWRTGASVAERTLSVTTDAGLTGGEGYRLWVAFDKPMRDGPGGTPAAAYPGLSVPAVGSVSLDGGPDSSALQVPIAGDLNDWLDAPGGAPNGYARYRYDAFGIDFEMPALTQATPLVLSLTVQDFAQQSLDANPATVVDWNNGAWAGYEDTFGEANDVGGSDCTLRTHAAPAGATGSTPAALVCKAAFVAPPAPVPPVPPVALPVSRGGGGGAPGVLLLPVLLALVCRRRRC